MKTKLSKLAILGIILSCLSLSACKSGIPKGVIKPTEMENVLYDYQIARTMADNLLYEDEYKRSLYIDYVFRKHNITQAQFDSSMVWYTREAEELTKIYEHLNKRLKNRQSELNHQIALRDKKPVITAKGDSVDIWYNDQLFYLTESPVSNKLVFRIPSDENFKAYDEFVWNIRYMFLGNPSQKPDVVMALSIYFENDSVISSVKTVRHSGITSLKLSSDSAFKIKEITGFVYYDNPGHKQASLLLDQINLMRYRQVKKAQNPVKTEDKGTVGEVSRNDSGKIEIRRDTLSRSSDSIKKPARINPRDLDRPRARKR